MKIIIVIDSVEHKTNGSVMTALRFAEGLKERGNQVKLVSVGASGAEDCALNERYIPLLTEVSARNQIKYGKFDSKKVRQCFEGADVIHFIFPFHLEKKCKKLADEMGIPTTAAFHVQPENVSFNIHLGWCKPLNRFIYALFRKDFYKSFRRIHCPSAFIANQLTAHGYQQELYVISNGYDPAFIPPTQKSANEKFKIVMSGRLANEKNQKTLIAALAKSKYKQNVALTLYGNGPYKNALMRQAKRLGVDVTFDFLPKSELITALQNADLYVHSAKVEIEAIACLEAIACGLVPVIANSPLSATPQFALDERSLFEAGNSQDLADKIDYWYEHEKERRLMGLVYAQSAEKYNLNRSIAMAEKMFQDEIDDKKASVS